MASLATTRGTDDPNLPAQTPEAFLEEPKTHHCCDLGSAVIVTPVLGAVKTFFTLMHHAVADGHAEGSRIRWYGGIRPRCRRSPGSVLKIAAGEIVDKRQKLDFPVTKGVFQASDYNRGGGVWLGLAPAYAPRWRSRVWRHGWCVCPATANGRATQRPGGVARGGKNRDLADVLAKCLT